MKKRWIWGSLVVVFFLIGAVKTFFKKSEIKSTFSMTQKNGNSYWTCPMHPAVHSDKPGECPICHMKLVQVKEQTAQSVNQKDTSRTDVQTTAEQMTLLGVQKQKVEKMDLKAHVPISGRLISASTVAFQVYETDLRYVKSGLRFRGESSLSPETPLEGIVTSVDSVIDPTSRTVRVVGRLQKSPSGLLSETTFRGDIELELKDRLAIPESAILHTGRGDLVYLFADGNRLSPRAVTLGMKAESFYEVLSGLTVGDMISSGPNFLIDSEAKIRGANDQTNH